MCVVECGCGVSVVQRDVGGLLVVVSHGGQSCLDGFAVVVVGSVDGFDVGPSVSFHENFADGS